MIVKLFTYSSARLSTGFLLLGDYGFFIELLSDNDPG
jgi:hypothetical protein